MGAPPFCALHPRSKTYNAKELQLNLALDEETQAPFEMIDIDTEAFTGGAGPGGSSSSVVVVGGGQAQPLLQALCRRIRPASQGVRQEQPD